MSTSLLSGYGEHCLGYILAFMNTVPLNLVSTTLNLDAGFVVTAMSQLDGNQVNLATP